MDRQRRSGGPDHGVIGKTAVQRAPGKTTLVEQLPPPPLARPPAAANAGAAVQAKGEPTGPGVHEAAERGVSGPATSLPHGQAIQEAFGRHDVSGINAHVGGPAEHAAQQMGASAYATGHHVAFAGAPDLHTAAHEAAHVVQQRSGVQLAGGVGQRGDAYEQHADAVADAVVSGKSAEGLLDRHAGGGGGAAAIQRHAPPQTPAPVGRAEATSFGTYWVVPNGTGPQSGVTGEQMSETDFTALKAVWTKLGDGSGQIKITETGSDGTAYAGFKAKMLTQFGKLLSKPVGRGVVTGLISAGHTITIAPSAAHTVAGARRGATSVEKPDGTANTGSDTTIMIEAGLADTDIVCFDAAGNRISAPIFLILGHELIHATHNDAGRNQSGKAATDTAAYPNREEEDTIANGSGATENKIRAENGLTARKGHAIVDTR